MTRDKLGSINMLSLFVNSMIGIKVLTLPRDLVIYSGTRSWMSLMIGALVALFTGLSLYWLGMKNPGLNTTQIVLKLMGRPIALIIMVVASFYFIGTAGLSLRIFADSINIFLLSNTPMSFVIIVMMLAGLYAVKQGLKVISIVFDLLLPVILFFIILLILLPVNNIDPKNLLPVFYGDIMPVIKGGYKAIEAFFGFAIIGYALPHFVEPKGVKKWIFISVAVCFSIYLGILLMALMIFGSNEISYLIYPTITLTKAIQLRVQLFERAESFFMAAWIPNAFTTLVIYYYLSIINIRSVFSKLNYNILAYCHFPLIFFVAMFPRNVVASTNYLVLLDNYIGKALVFFLVPGLIVLQLYRQRRKKK